MTAADDRLGFLLAELEERLKGWGAPVVEAFRPGASPEQVRATFAAEALATPPDAVVWWGWHDGAVGPTVPEGPGIVDAPESALIDHWYLISLADAVRIRRWHRDTAAEVGEAEAELLLPASWFPVLHSLAAFLCIDTLAGDDRPAPLYIVDWPGKPANPPRPQFTSLGELVEIIVRLFDARVVTPDPDDPRLPSLRGAPIENQDVRRLALW